jgi:hypothetical protein
MATKFDRDLLSFRRHVLALRAAGYAHISVKYNGKEYHVESPAPLETDARSSGPIGFGGGEPDGADETVSGRNR